MKHAKRKKAGSTPSSQKPSRKGVRKSGAKESGSGAAPTTPETQTEGAKVGGYTPEALANCKAVFREWLELPYDTVLDFVFGLYFANKLGGDPVWGGIIGASGDTKTEVLRSLVHPDLFPLSNLTSKSLISGWSKEANGGEEPSLLPKLDGKLLIVKDLTPLISGNGETMNLILGQFRDAYDGYSSTAFGTGETKAFKSKFGFLFGVTPAVEACWPVIAQLGERFCYFRCPEGDALKKVEAALKNSDKKVQMRKELQDSALKVLALPVPPDTEVSPGIQERLIHLSDLLARARTPVKRDGRTEEVTYLPSSEVGTRIVGQLVLLARGIAIARDQTTVDDAIMEVIVHVVRSGIPHARLKCLDRLRQSEGPLSTVQVGQKVRLGSGSVKRALEDLWTLGLVDRETGGRGTGYLWKLSGVAQERFAKAGIRAGSTEAAPEPDPIPPDECTPSRGSEPKNGHSGSDQRTQKPKSGRPSYHDRFSPEEMELLNQQRGKRGGRRK